MSKKTVDLKPSDWRWKFREMIISQIDYNYWFSLWTPEEIQFLRSKGIRI